ncbi:RNA pseudouridine synthase [uncultured Eubacterium sp.]|uniref:RluA family pseudouridine synthase n=1 Tax=uncultured Eubacterium sp. TaxID=165185 RepID=UPI00326659D1
MADGKMNKVIYEDNHLLVVEKPQNVLVQADNTNDLDLLTSLKKYIKEKYNKPGEVYLGLVHRLDRPVGGVMVFARTSKSASRLSNMIRIGEFEKTYLAVVEGMPPEEGAFEDYLLKLENENRTIVGKNGKYSKLSYKLLGFKDGLSLVKIKLETGRSHQIRVQFSSRGYALWGDQKYNSKADVGEQIALWAYELKFKHPVRDEIMDFKCNPPLKYPWTLFGDVIHD